MLSWLASNVAALSALGAAVVFAWSAIQFMLVRSRDQRTHEFEAYHRLIKELVQPDAQSGVAWIDRQMAVVFELRHFSRYYPVTERILNNLLHKWTADPEFKWPPLIAEIELTLKHIKSKT